MLEWTREGVKAGHPIGGVKGYFVDCSSLELSLLDMV